MSPRQVPPGKPERRSAARFTPSAALKAQLLLELDSSVLTLSARGMMVRLGFAPPLGSPHKFVLGFGTRTIQVQGVVRNVHPEGRGAFAVGVEFQDLNREDGEFI